MSSKESVQEPVQEPVPEPESSVLTNDELLYINTTLDEIDKEYEKCLKSDIKATPNKSNKYKKYKQKYIMLKSNINKN